MTTERDPNAPADDEEKAEGEGGEDAATEDEGGDPAEADKGQA